MNKLTTADGTPLSS